MKSFYKNANSIFPVSLDFLNRNLLKLKPDNIQETNLMGKYIAGFAGAVFTVFLAVVIGAIAFSKPSATATKPVDRVHESFERMSNKCQQFKGAVTFDDKLKWARCMDAQLPTEMYRW
jgi:deoxyribodipyrimidine photolyase-like uncharacterized protein